MVDGNSNESNGRLPHHFVTFVEILFAVVLGASLLEFHTLLFPPAVAQLSFWALVTVYFAAVTSWVSWHKSTIEYPYTDSGAGRVRSILDAAIVGGYAALLFFGSGVHTSLSWYLWGFVIVFFLYWAVGNVRRAEYHDPRASQIYLIVRHSAALLVGAIAYTILVGSLSPLPTVAEWLFVFLPLVTVASFRWFGVSRRLSWTVRVKKGKSTIALDMDGVLVEQVVPVLEKLKYEMDVDLKKCDITDWEYPFKGTNIKVEIERAEREEEFVRQMPPVEGASEALRILSERFNIIVATSREPCTDSWSRDWLDAHGMQYDRLVNTRSDGKALPRVDFLIDDYIGNIEEFIRNGPPGRQAILFAQPWNHNTKTIADLVAARKVRIAHSWQAVLATLGCGLPGAELTVGGTQSIRSDHANEIRKDYFALQAVSCFLARFLLLRG